MNAADQAYNLILPEKKAAFHLEEVKRILRKVKGISSTTSSTDGPLQPDEKTLLLQEAISHIRKGITLASRDVMYYLIAADVYEALLDNSSACAHLRYALNVIGVESSEHPFGFEKDMKHRLADLLFRRARGWLECGNSGMAMEALTEATTLRPSEPKAWLLMAMARLQHLDNHSHSYSVDLGGGGKSNGGISNEQLTLVLGCLDKAIELGKECQAYILRGKVNWALGQTEAGNRDFRSAAALDAGHPEVLIFQNIMFSEAGNLYADAKKFVNENDLDSAVKSLTLAIKAAPEDLRLVVMRASVLRKMGCLEDSFVDLDRAARMYFVARYSYQVFVYIDTQDKDKQHPFTSLFFSLSSLYFALSQI
jgi:tetratricopeptide (TPR) repeat protein